MIGALTAAAALPRVMLSALAACVGVSVVFSLAVLGAARYSDARRADRNGAAAVFGLLALLALTACAATVVYGVVLIARKN